MSFLGGPPKDITLQMAQGVASILIEVLDINRLPDAERTKQVLKLREAGAPALPEEVTRAAAQVVEEQHMGWLRKNQYMGFIFGSLVAMGMEESDASYWKSVIQITAGF